MPLDGNNTALADTFTQILRRQLYGRDIYTEVFCDELDEDCDEDKDWGYEDDRFYDDRYYPDPDDIEVTFHALIDGEEHWLSLVLSRDHMGDVNYYSYQLRVAADRIAGIVGEKDDREFAIESLTYAT